MRDLGDRLIEKIGVARIAEATREAETTREHVAIMEVNVTITSNLASEPSGVINRVTLVILINRGKTRETINGY